MEIRQLTEDYSVAGQIGLDVAQFSQDLEEGRLGEKVREDVASAEASGVTGTPTFFIGNRRHTGPYDAETLARELLESAGRGDSGPSGPERTPATA